MKQIVSVMQLEGVEIKELERFIAHWKKIKDMPCEDMRIEMLGERNL